MTGFGEARCQCDSRAVSVEVRTINSRYLKLSTRISEGYASLESQIEAIVRDRVRRATVQVNVRIDRDRTLEDYKIDVDVLDGYRRQLLALNREWNLAEEVSLGSLLALPGVVNEESAVHGDPARQWPLVQETLEKALANLDRMRRGEGQTMSADLLANCRAAAASLAEIERRAPLVVDNYRARLTERLKRTLAELDVALDPRDIIKEVSLFADRSDISEEIVRLRSHCEQFEAVVASPESSGRKLDFLTQEMNREANTIGSKASDVEISRQVIEIKSAIERIREMIQNVE
jgi:uncharacterized protein (TIGR00255 family)